MVVVGHEDELGFEGVGQGFEEIYGLWRKLEELAYGLTGEDFLEYIGGLLPRHCTPYRPWQIWNYSHEGRGLWSRYINQFLSTMPQDAGDV